MHHLEGMSMIEYIHPNGAKMTLTTLTAWGDGPDIMITQTWQTNDGVKVSYIDLNIEQLPQFIEELTRTALNAQDLQSSYNEYMRLEECLTKQSNQEKNTESLFVELKQ